MQVYAGLAGIQIHMSTTEAALCPCIALGLKGVDWRGSLWVGLGVSCIRLGCIGLDWNGLDCFGLDLVDVHWFRVGWMELV